MPFDFLFGRKPRLPEFIELDLESPEKVIEEFSKQFEGASFDRISQVADDLNDYTIGRISQLYPNFRDQFRDASDTTGALIRGELPEDVQALVRENASEASFQAGFLPSSGIGTNLTARTLGLTSLDLQDKGLSRLKLGTDLARSVNPYNPGMLGLSSQDIAGRLDQETLYNTQGRQELENLEAARSGKKGAFPVILGAIGGAVGGYFGGSAGAQAGYQFGSGIGGAASEGVGGYRGDEGFESSIRSLGQGAALTTSGFYRQQSPSYTTALNTYGTQFQPQPSTGGGFGGSSGGGGFNFLDSFMGGGSGSGAGGFALA